MRGKLVELLTRLGQDVVDIGGHGSEPVDYLNVLCLSGDMLGDRLVDRLVEIWLKTPFDGGRHARRLAKIAALESRNGQ